MRDVRRPLAADPRRSQDGAQWHRARPDAGLRGGFDILKNAGTEALPHAERFDLDIAEIAEVWRRGSVITSWLLDLTASALVEDANLDGYSGFVQHSGEGPWTIQAAIDEAVPAIVRQRRQYQR
jgi:6-phosphogluconate dehydrogenase